MVKMLDKDFLYRRMGSSLGLPWHGVPWCFAVTQMLVVHSFGSDSEASQFTPDDGLLEPFWHLQGD